jgi:hypothetical protein
VDDGVTWNIVDKTITGNTRLQLKKNTLSINSMFHKIKASLDIHINFIYMQYTFYTIYTSLYSPDDALTVGKKEKVGTFVSCFTKQVYYSSALSPY